MVFTALVSYSPAVRFILQPAAIALVSFGLISCSAGEITEPARQITTESPAPPFRAAAPSLVRLTDAQYRATISDVLGETIILPSSLEPDVPVDGLLAVGASRTSISSRGVEQYEDAAYSIAEQFMADETARSRWLSCELGTTFDESCARDFITSVGRALWRRPLEDEEIARLVIVTDRATMALESFQEALQFPLAALLMAPDFLFRAELGEATRTAERVFTDFEMASRLAFFLWNTAPDEALLDAAAAGELTSDATLADHVDAMLEDPRARDGIRSFFADMLELYKLDDLSKDPTIFVHMNAEVGPSAREETLLGVEHLVFDRDADYRELFTTETSFVNRKLAAIYDIPAPVREGFGQVTLPSDRAGLLGQVSVLALQSHPSASSATLRGLFIRKVLLCGSIPPPPADLNTALPEVSGTARTLRERVNEHLENPSCAACHNLMDPIGLGLENYDGLGRFRLFDNDVEIDASGELAGVDYVDAQGLGEAIADSPDATTCLVRTLYRYATGHVETSGETITLRALHDDFAREGYRVRALLRSIALSRGFREARRPSATETEEGER